MNPSQALDTGVVDLIGTATAFGQGAIASAISGNPYYSQDPAAANYATIAGISPNTTNSLGGNLGLIVIAVIAYFLLRK